MALTINQAMLHAIALIKGPSTYASSEEVRMANTVQSIISSYYRWHWLITSGQDIAISSGTQSYSLNATDQNKVSAILHAQLDNASGTAQPELLLYSDQRLPGQTAATGQPFAVCLESPTRIRLYPNPNATFTFRWAYYARPVIFTANSESFQIPEAFTDVAKAGMKWQVLDYADDDRAATWKQTFYDLLKNHRQVEERTMGRTP